MTTLSLGLYSAGLIFLLPQLLRAPWSRRAPRAAAAVWLAGEVAAVVTVFFLLLALVVPLLSVGHAVLALVDFCGQVWDQVPHALRTHLPGSPAAIVVLVLVLRVGLVTAAVVVPQRRHRRWLRDSISLIGRPGPFQGVTLVELDHPAAWCIPGRARRVCVTSAALAVLSPSEAEAVVRHERAHLRARHHLLVTAVDVLDRAFPKVPLFRLGRTEMRRLVEMMADDSAATVSGSPTLAGALVRLAGQPAPAAGLAAGGSTAAERAWRLLAGRPPLTGWRRRSLGLAAAGLLLLPLGLVAAPAMVDAGQHCPSRSVAAAPRQFR